MTPTEEAAAAAATQATCARRRCRVRLCVPRGGGAPSGASVHAGSMPPASPTPRADGHGPRRLRLPRTEHAGPAAACAAGLRPPPIRPAAWEASVGGVRGFRSPGPGACVPRASSSSLRRARAPRVRSHRFTTIVPVFTFKTHTNRNLTQEKRVPSPRPLGPYLEKNLPATAAAQNLPATATAQNRPETAAWRSFQGPRVEHGAGTKRAPLTLG